MSYEEIKAIIDQDYVQLEQTRKLVAMRNARGTNKTFYLNFSRALEELHQATSPFITSKEDFIEHIKYIKGRVSSEVYYNIAYYCKEKLKLIV